MAVLLWDNTSRVGCSKVCCNTRELVICDFAPIIQNISLNDLSLHVKSNKYIK